jgi:hypothetical protein
MMIKVGIKKGDDQYPDKNVIKGYKPLEGKASAAPPAAKKFASGGKQAAFPATKKSTPPWARPPKEEPKEDAPPADFGDDQIPF